MNEKPNDENKSPRLTPEEREARLKDARQQAQEMVDNLNRNVREEWSDKPEPDTKVTFELPRRPTKSDYITMWFVGGIAYVGIEIALSQQPFSVPLLIGGTIGGGIGILFFAYWITRWKGLRAGWVTVLTLLAVYAAQAMG